MLSLFQRKKVYTPAANTAPSPPPSKGLRRPESAASLLATPRRQKLLEHIWQRTSLSRQQFASLYRAPLERYAALVQQFPASESHHHSYHGGMLDHGLEIVAYALKLRQSYLLPVGTTSEDQATQSEAWTAATAYAALLHDIGKIAVDLQVEQADGKTWHPWHGPLRQPYRFRYREDREYRLHSAATGLLYHQLLDPEILDWLSGYPVLWASLLYVMAGQYEHAGVLGELVVQADRASVAQELGGDPARALTAPKSALQRKLLDGLRYLLKEQLRLNQLEASDGWLTADALWLVSKTVSDKLRAHLLSQGLDGIPANNTAVFNVLQDHGILQPTPDGKAIWRATVTSPTGWSHSFTLLRLAPALIWENGDRPASYAGTVVIDGPPAEGESTSTWAIDVHVSPEHAASSANMPTPTDSPAMPQAQKHAPTAGAGTGDSIDDLLSIFGVAEASATAPLAAGAPALRLYSQDDAELASPRLQRHAVPPETGGPAFVSARPSGEHFIAWMRNRIQMHTLIINDTRALVHSVADTVFLVSPGVFQRYAKEHPHIAPVAKQENISEWQWVQKQFERLRAHRKQPSGMNIWVCEVRGQRKSKRLHGYLLIEPLRVFETLPPNNPHLVLLE